jgi:hypothetical protein
MLFICCILLLGLYIGFLYCHEIGIIMLFLCLIVLFLTIVYLSDCYVIILVALLAIYDVISNLPYLFNVWLCFILYLVTDMQ